MVNVVNSPRGTAYKSRITELGQEMAGKTGQSMSAASRKPSEKLGTWRPALEGTRPRLVCGLRAYRKPAAISVVEHGGGGQGGGAHCSGRTVEAQRRDSAGELSPAQPRPMEPMIELEKNEDDSLNPPEFTIPRNF